MVPDAVNATLSLYRRFLWVWELRARYRASIRRHGAFIHQAVSSHQVGSYEEAFKPDMYLCLWFSALNVVIEGWPALRQRDERLTPLLRSPNKRLLSGFRDAVFHPADWDDARMDLLIRQGDSSFQWVDDVTLAFRLFFEPVAAADRKLRRRLRRK